MAVMGYKILIMINNIPHNLKLTDAFTIGIKHVNIPRFMKDGKLFE